MLPLRPGQDDNHQRGQSRRSDDQVYGPQKRTRSEVLHSNIFIIFIVAAQGIWSTGAPCAVLNS